MTTLCEVKPTGTDVTYYLLSKTHEEPDERIDMILTDGLSAWKGQVTHQDVADQAKKAKMTFKELWEQSVKALTRQDMGILVFEYQTKSSGNSMTFTWKKHVAAEDIKFQLGTTVLEKLKDSAKAVCRILDHSLRNLQKLSEKITNLEVENERLTAERASALKRLEKCVAAKEDMEHDLFSKFVVVVNDKKAKIRKLKEEIEELRYNVPSSSNNHKKVVSSPKRRRLESDSEHDTDNAQPSEYDYETDEEKPAQPTQSSTQVKSTQAKKPAPTDDSLILDDEDDDGGTAVTRRKRRQSSMKKQTPSKPVIPRVSSTTPVAGSSGRKPPMRKRASNVSSKSSEDLEPDELLDNLA